LNDCVFSQKMLGLNGRRTEEDDDVLKPLVEDEHSSIGDAALSYASSSLDKLIETKQTTTLRIKSSHGDTVLEFASCPKTTSVAKLKSLVRTALEGDNSVDLQDCPLRLICKGKLLSPDDGLLSEFKVANEDVVHAVLGKKEEPPPPARRGQRQPTGISHLLQHQRRRRQRQNRGIGTIVGPGGRVTRAARAGDESDEDEEDPRERRGFDRLRGAGMSRQEITAIRTYFNRHVDRYIQQLQQQEQNNEESPPAALHLDEPDLSRRRLLVEEEWMQTQGTSSEFRLNLNQNTLMRYAQLTAGGMATRSGSLPRERPGSDRDFLWGFCLGFFVGIIGLVWVWMPTISHKQKLGILAGICFQLLLQPKNFDENEIYEEGTYENGN